MIEADPRLGDLLTKDFLELLVQLLKHERNLKLQINAATILQRLVIRPMNKAVAAEIKNITPVVLNLLHSEEYLVRLELKLALSALMKLIKSDNLPILSCASRGLSLLCDGRKEMVVEDEYLDCLIERLLDLLNADSRIMIISALSVLGSIVRWGSDNVIEAIINKEDALDSLMCLLEEDDMYYVKQACWIISNITARKEEHIKAVIDCKLIDALFDVVENYKLVDVKKEALWEISNDMCGVGPDQIECLRNSCSKVLQDELLCSFGDDSPLLFVTLEGLINMKMAKVICDGRPIDTVELYSFFMEKVYPNKWLPGFKILFLNNNVQNSDGRVKYNLVFKFEGGQLL